MAAVGMVAAQRPARIAGAKPHGGGEVLERVQETHKRSNGAIIEVYLRKRSRRVYTCRVTFPDGRVMELGGFGAVNPAMEWGIAKADANADWATR
jgi:hypothetical protein